MTAGAKYIFVIGGPNGAGKTTAANILLPRAVGVTEFVNADDIARAISPGDVDGAAIAAGRAMLERLDSLLAGGRDFSFETTCAGRGHAAFLRRAKDQGWHVALLFLWLRSPELALERVCRRVQQGGHDIPPDVIARRYRKGIANLRDVYLPLSDSAAVYDNSDFGRRLIADKSIETGFVIHDVAAWKAIESVKP